MVFYAPTVNSYKRYVDASWAPTRLAWSHDNRTAGFRVVGDGQSLRIECRIPGADCNPYLALAGVARLRPRRHREQASSRRQCFVGDVYARARPAARALHAARGDRRASRRARSRGRRSATTWSSTTRHFFRTEQAAYDAAVTDWERSAILREDLRRLMRLDGKVALITGARQRHRPRVRAALRQGRRGGRRASTSTSTAARETAALVRTAGGRARYCRADVSQRGRLRARWWPSPRRSSASSTCCSTTPASCTRRTTTPSTTDEAVWDLTMDINAKGVFLGCKYGIPALRRAGGGSIINTASFVAVLGAATPQIAYTASKGAVLALTRELAVDPRAARTSASTRSAPGPLRTELLMKFLEHRGEEAAAPRAHPDGPLRRGARRSPRRRCSSPPTSRRSSPAPSSSSTAGSPRPTSRLSK